MPYSSSFKRAFLQIKSAFKRTRQKVKAILDAPYQLDLPIDIQISGEYDRTATWYGTIGWYENRVEEFKNDKTNYKKILYTLLSWNFDDRTYDLITKIQNILYQNHGLLIQYAQQTEYKLRNYKNIIENRDKTQSCSNKKSKYILQKFTSKNKRSKNKLLDYFSVRCFIYCCYYFCKRYYSGVSALEAFLCGDCKYAHWRIIASCHWLFVLERQRRNSLLSSCIAWIFFAYRLL